MLNGTSFMPSLTISFRLELRLFFLANQLVILLLNISPTEEFSALVESTLKILRELPKPPVLSSKLPLTELPQTFLELAVNSKKLLSEMTDITCSPNAIKLKHPLSSLEVVPLNILRRPKDLLMMPS